VDLLLREHLSRAVPLVLGGLELGFEHVRVHADLVRALIHGELELRAPVFEAVHVVHRGGEEAPELAHLELEHVVGHGLLLLALHEGLEVRGGRVVAQRELVDGAVHASLLLGESLLAAPGGREVVA